MKKLPYPLLFVPLCLFGQTFVPDPLSDDYPISELAVKLEKVFQIPSSGSGPLTRITHLKQPNDGSGRLFVNDLRGKLWVWNGSGNPSQFVDLDAQFPRFIDSPGLGTGFNSFAFHPDFATNGKFYTSHNESNGSDADVKLKNGRSPQFQGVITEWTMDNPSRNVWYGLAGNRRELLRVEIVGSIHGLQEIAFNKTAKPGDPDYGLLYICHGDGGAYVSGKLDVAYTLDTFHSTILRIDPDGNNGRTGEYGIPSDNPWANDNDPDTWDEIYARGFRNCHRISWDLGGEHTMIEGDIGERNIEEINIIEPGNHYGWPYREGTFLFYPEISSRRDNVYTLPANDASAGYTYPVIQYDHFNSNRVHQTSAITGGYVSRSNSVPRIWGQYLFGEISNGEIYHAPIQDMINAEEPIWFHRLRLIDEDNNEKTLLNMVNQTAGGSRADLRFGEDQEGNIFVLTKRDGWIRKIVPAPEDENPMWGSYPVQFADGIYWADTGSWLGTVNVRFASVGWVYAYNLDKWIYLPESHLAQGQGAWTYITGN